MALSNKVHVACSFVGASGQGSRIQDLTRSPVWSETLSAAGVTTQAAPASSSSYGDPCFEISAGVDVYVAIGPTPDASQAVGSTGNSARLVVRSGETRNVFCKQGDKLAYVLA